MIQTQGLLKGSNKEEVTQDNAPSALKQDRDTVALDYYLSGLKINPSHLGCIYNVGCCHYFTKKFANAEKWFSLAIKLDPSHLDSYIGKTVSCIKLGRYQEALDTVDIVFKWQEWTSTSYTQDQMYFIYAICAKITSKFDLAKDLYEKLREGIRLSMNRKMANKTCSLLLLPLEKSRSNYVDRVHDFIELLNFLNQLQNSNLQCQRQLLARKSSSPGIPFDLLTSPIMRI